MMVKGPIFNIYKCTFSLPTTMPYVDIPKNGSVPNSDSIPSNILTRMRNIKDPDVCGWSFVAPNRRKVTFAAAPTVRYFLDQPKDDSQADQHKSKRKTTECSTEKPCSEQLDTSLVCQFAKRLDCKNINTDSSEPFDKYDASEGFTTPRVPTCHFGDLDCFDEFVETKSLVEMIEADDNKRERQKRKRDKPKYFIDEL